MVTAFCVYLCIHALVYVLWGRKSAYFTAESHIFLFHALPGVVVTAIAGSAWLLAPSQDSFAAFVFVVSLQGIYSISFLELWSLAQGGYSISILGEIARAQANGVTPDLDALGSIGMDKQRGRLDGLARLGLLSLSGDGRHGLTRRGRLVASAIAAIRRTANLRDMG
jgi:hypothetical protein